MHMVRHDNKSLKLEVARAAIMLQRFEEHLRVRRNLEEPATIKGRGRDKERAKA
jgi:hypothetical protein